MWVRILGARGTSGGRVCRNPPVLSLPGRPCRLSLPAPLPVQGVGLPLAAVEETPCHRSFVRVVGAVSVPVCGRVTCAVSVGVTRAHAARAYTGD